MKADAVPGVDNIAYLNARDTGPFQIRCAELCGLWHGHMAKHGQVLTFSDFQSWIAAEKKQNTLTTEVPAEVQLGLFPSAVEESRVSEEVTE